MSVPLINTAPAGGHGHPLVDDLRLVVEAWLPTVESARWGISLWNGDEWAGYRWVDITSDVRGISINRGNDAPYGPPRVGTADLTLDTRDGDWSLWTADPTYTDRAEFGPGVPIRIVLADSVTWWPLFLGETDEWPETDVAGGADRFVSLTIVEPIARLASIDWPGSIELGSVDDTISARAARILAAAAYPYGLTVAAGADPGVTFPETTLAGNLITQLQEAALVALTEAGADERGRVAITARYRLEGTVTAALAATTDAADDHPGVPVWGYDLTEFVTSADTEHVVNDYIINGTRYEHTPSVARFGRRTQTVTLPVGSPATWGAQNLWLRARHALRIDDVTLTLTGHLEQLVDVITTVTLGRLVAVYPPHVDQAAAEAPHLTGWVASLTHTIAPIPAGGADWTVVATVDTANIHHLPGAELPWP